MRKIISISIVAILLILGCGTTEKGEKLPAAEEEQIELGKKQWREDYVGDNREITPEQALMAAKRSVAYSNLRRIVELERDYFGESREYAELEAIGFRPSKDDVYEYSVEPAASGPVLNVRATGNLDNDPHRDVVVMNQDGNSEIVEDDIRNWKQGDGLSHPGRHIQKARNVQKKLDRNLDRKLREGTPPQ